MVRKEAGGSWEGNRRVPEGSRRIMVREQEDDAEEQDGNRKGAGEL
jgi:hypothetical protein